MTTRFRLDAIIVDTAEGDFKYQFPAALTVLAGPVGVGKSTLLELVKHALGGKALLAPVVLASVTDVTIYITIGGDRYAFSRGIDPAKQKMIRIVDLITGERLVDHYVDSAKTPSIDSFLLQSLGLPTDMRAAARTKSSTNPGARISFADIFAFMYVPQADMNRDIAASTDNYRDPKRKSVFELLFGLTDPGLLAMRSQLTVLNARLQQAVHDAEVVRNFLSDSNTTSKIDASIALEQAIQEANSAMQEIDTLRQAVEPVVDRETQTLRDLLAEAESSLMEARSAATRLSQQQADYSAERNRLVQDLDRLTRLQDAGDRLAAIEFMVCPRCMQDVHGRDTPHDLCRLCLQPDPVSVIAASSKDETYEQRQLTEQLAEMDEQLLAVAEQLASTHEAIAHRQTLVQKLSDDINERSQGRLAPQLQAFTDTAGALATAKARQHELEGVLRQWDHANDLDMAADRLRGDAERLLASIRDAETQLLARRREIIGELNDEFSKTLNAIGVPVIRTARIHPTNYLPVLNEKPFDKFSPPGGTRTIVQISYWISLLTVALRRRDTLYPAFLLIDSPRTSLNNSEEISAAMYRRIVAQADADADRFQIIVADNELPSKYRKDYDQLDFDYEHPTIAPIEHPGQANVETITQAVPV